MRIIGATLLALALGACSMLRLAYDQSPSLVYWWMDGYADFDGAQTQQVRRVIDDWFGWHRRSQLPGYTALLTKAQTQVELPITAADACGWQDEVARQAMAAFHHAVPQLAGLALTLTPAQVRHIERRFAKNNDEYRDEYLQDDPADRREAVLERAVERVKTLYGSVGEAQLAVMERGLQASPFDPDLWLAERQARQREVLDTLRSLDAGAPDAKAQVESALRRLAEHAVRSPRPAYRAYRERLDAYNCELMAQIHNAATLAQRRAARERLAGWESELRLLAGRAAPAVDPAAARGS